MSPSYTSCAARSHPPTPSTTSPHTWLFISVLPDNPQNNLGHLESAAIRQCSLPLFWRYPMFVVFQKLRLLVRFFLLFLYVLPLKDARPVRHFYLSCFLFRACSTYFHLLVLFCHIIFPVLFCYKPSGMAVTSGRLTFRILTKQDWKCVYILWTSHCRFFISLIIFWLFIFFVKWKLYQISPVWLFQLKSKSSDWKIFIKIFSIVCE
jgi:hypothetical protein